MTEKRARGRPKKPQEPLPLGPAPLRIQSSTAKNQMHTMLESMNTVEQNLIKSVLKKRPTIKHEHALCLALENELNKTESEELKNLDKQLLKKEKKYVTDGGITRGGDRARSKAQRLATILEKNRALIAQLRPVGKYSASAAASIILDSWTVRGDTGTPPSISTLRKWIKK